MAHLCRWALRFDAAMPASAGMAMIWPTYAGGLCALMLLCVASAGIAVIGPNDAGGPCALMLLCLLVQAWRCYGPPMQANLISHAGGLCALHSVAFYVGQSH